MFRLDPQPTFPATVQISQPGGGQLPLRLVFRHQTSTQLKEFLAAQGLSNSQMLERMVAGVHADDKPADMADAVFLERVLEAYPASASDILRTYLRELTESRVKNS